jgi:hypothetical protein
MALETVHATFNYTRDNGVMPEVYFYEPPPGTKIRDPGDDPHEMAVVGWDRAVVLPRCEGSRCVIPLVIHTGRQRSNPPISTAM